MTTLSPTHSLPTAEEVAIARESGRALSAFLQTRAETQQIEIFDDKGAAHPVRVPVSALRLLVDVLTEIGEGNAVSIIPIHAELTTQDAADVLNVSRPFLVRDHVLIADAPVCSDLVEWDLAALQQLHEERSRNVEDVRRSAESDDQQASLPSLSRGVSARRMTLKSKTPTCTDFALPWPTPKACSTTYTSTGM